MADAFEDNDCSAYGRKPRRAYDRMLAPAESRAVDAIVTWHNDRLNGHPGNWKCLSTWSSDQVCA